MEKQKITGSRKKAKTKQRGLAAKTSISVAIVLAVFLIIMVFGSALAASIKLNRSVTKHLTAISVENGTMVQNIMDNTAQYVSSLTNYMESKFPEYEELLASQQVDENGELIPFETKASRVYNVDLIDFNQEVEDYLLYTIWSVVGGDDMVCGMGVFFEPEVFDPAIRDYTLYVGPSEAASKTAQSYGAYTSYGSQEWYTGPAQTQKPYISSVYLDQGVRMFTISYPILYQNAVQGVITVDVDIDVFSQLNSEDETYDSLYATVLSDDSSIIYDSEGKDQVGVLLSSLRSSEVWNEISSKMSRGELFRASSVNSSGAKEESFFYPISAEDGSTWWSMISVYTSDKEKEIVSLVILMLFFAVLALVVIILFSTFFVARMLKPLHNVVSAAEEIAAGNLDVKLNVTSEDEIGQLAATFQKMSDNLRTIIQDMDYLLTEMSNGNFRVHTQAEELYIGEYQGMLRAIRVINRSLSETLNQINQSSEQVNEGSGQVSDGAQALSQGATEQAASVEELVSIIKEVETQTNQTAVNAQNANYLMGEVGSGIQVSNEKMQDMLHAMNEISQKSNEIGKIIKAIDDIAFQTNILALNAAVEAARAGSAGKGFAVVADEVRNLAQKSAESVKTTTALIEDTTTAVSNGVTIAQDTAKALNDIIETTEKTVQNIQEISDAANDQASAFTQITTGMDQISNVVQTNAATAQESAAASEVLSQEANNLKNMIAKFRLREE